MENITKVIFEIHNETYILDLNKSLDNFGTCNLDQQAMLSSLERMPTIILYLFILVFLLLVFHFFIMPSFKNKDWYEYNRDNAGLMAMSICFLGCWTLSMYVFDISHWDLQKITHIGFFVLILVLIYISWRWLRKYWRNEV
jgi:cbb3-type cytochrome oxidase subunit 3